MNTRYTRKGSLITGLIVAMALLLTPLVGGHAHAQAAGGAHIRFVHAGFDAPGVDIYLNNNKVFSNQQYKSVSDWSAQPAGSYSVKVTAAGNTEAILQTEVNLKGDKYDSLVAAGKLANISAKLLEDDLSALPAGKARVRLVHASPDTPAVDADLNNGLVLVPNLGFLDASSYLEMNAGTVDVKVRPAGTSSVALASGVSLDANTVYTFLVVGQSKGAPPLSVFPVLASPVGAPKAEALPASGPATSTSQAPMPKTGAADGLAGTAPAAFALAALFLVLGGAATRTRGTRMR